MKKFFSLLLALATIGSASASVILHESFDGYEAEATLSAGRSDASTNDKTHWYEFANSGADITIAEGSLSYAGYVSEGKGGKAKLAGNGLRDLRQFNAVSTGKVYAAAIINAEALKASTTAGQFLALGDASNSKLFARLYVRSVQDGENFVGYNLGISKSQESYYRWTSETLLAGKDYLVVLEYEFVDGENNDITRLYINPTAKDQTPTLECVQDSLSNGGIQNGAKGKPDANYIASVNLSKNTNNPNPLYVDEIKVATEWADLFETQEENNATITAFPGILNFSESGNIELNVEYTTNFTVHAENLSGDIALTCDVEGVTLSPSTITKEAAESEEGALVTVTFTSNTLSTGEDYDEGDIVLTSGKATTTVTLQWYTMEIPKFQTIAELSQTIRDNYYIEGKFIGEMVVTYIFGNTYTLEDATDAFAMDAEYNWYSANIQLGDALTNFSIGGWLNDDNSLAYFLIDNSVEIKSHNNNLVPQEVTLAALLADTENKYLNHLVVVKNVLFDDTDVLLGSGNTPITQGETVANINLPAGNPLIDTAKPTKAVDITGVWAAGTMNTKYLRPRTAADIVEHTATGIEAATFDAATEIYTIQGMRVESLQPGVNIIRKGNTVYKVVR